MTDTHEALEALSKKATQGTIEVLMPETEHDHGVPLIATDYPGTFGPSNGLVLWATMLPTEITDKDTAQAEANAAFTAALWNAYRTGQLIPAPSVDDAVVERVARAINHVRFEDDGSSPCQDDYDMATAAIRIITTPPTGTPFKLAGCKEQADG